MRNGILCAIRLHSDFNFTKQELCDYLAVRTQKADDTVSDYGFIYDAQDFAEPTLISFQGPDLKSRY